METAEIKPLLNKHVKLRYGQNGVLVGQLHDLSSERVHIKNKQGDYGVPLDLITDVQLAPALT